MRLRGPIALSLIAIFVACVGEDPDPATEPSGTSSSSGSGSGGASGSGVFGTSGTAGVSGGSTSSSTSSSASSSGDASVDGGEDAGFDAGTPAIGIVPSPFAFPLTQIGKSSAAQVFTVTNLTSDSLGKLALTTLATSFEVVTDTCSNNELGGGGTCSLSLVFKPSGSGLQKSTLELVGSGGSGRAPISGSGGTAPALAPSVTKLELGNIPAAVYNDKRLTVRNIGGYPTTTKIKPTFSNPLFTLGTTDCDAPLEPNQECFIDVRIRSFDNGPQTGSVTLDAGDALTAKVDITATIVSPANLGLGHSSDLVPGAIKEGTSRLWHYEAVNSGDLPTDNVVLTVTGDGWSIVNDTCTGKPIKEATPGVSGKCAFDLKFAPAGKTVSTATITAKAGALTTSDTVTDESATACTTPNTACSSSPTRWCSNALGCSPLVQPGKSCNNNVQCQYGCKFNQFGYGDCCTSAACP